MVDRRMHCLTSEGAQSGPKAWPATAGQQQSPSTFVSGLPALRTEAPPEGVTAHSFTPGPLATFLDAATDFGLIGILPDYVPHVRMPLS